MAFASARVTFVKLERGTLAGAFLLLAAVLWHAWWASRGWHVLDLQGHEFRQSQTAIAIEAMKAEGFRLDYATPVLGKPWAIPMEFPLYQWLAATLSNRTGLPVVVAGRWISLGAFYLSLPALLLLVRAAGLGWGSAAGAMLPVLGAPIYVFYSRAVMIESTALAGAAWFLVGALEYHRGGRMRWLLVAWLAGSLAALVKITTLAAFFTPWGLVLAAEIWPAAGGRAGAAKRAAREVAVVALPVLLVGAWWIATADRIKAHNPLAGFLLSRNLVGFNFGTAGLRFDPAFWRTLFHHWTEGLLPWWGFVAVPVGACLLPARARRPVGLAAAAFLVPPLVFANLYWVHDYYHYASGVFLALATGFVGCGLWAAGGWRRGLGGLLLAAILAGQTFAYRVHYLPLQTRPATGDTGLTRAIRRLTGARDVLVVHGADWEPMIPFYAQRRALMIPDGQMVQAPQTVARSIAALHDEHVALVLFIGEARQHLDWIRQRIADFHLRPAPLFLYRGEVAGFAAEEDYGRCLDLLQHERFADLDIADLTSAADPTRVHPFDSAMYAGAFPGMSPPPVRGMLPFGLTYADESSRRVFLAQTPTELYFKVPPGAATVEIVYHVAEAAYGHRDFDGVRFLVEYRPASGATITLLDSWMGPELPVAERGPRTRVLALPPGADGEVVVGTLPGPANSQAFDWALIESLKIR